MTIGSYFFKSVLHRKTISGRQLHPVMELTSSVSTRVHDLSRFGHIPTSDFTPDRAMEEISEETRRVLNPFSFDSEIEI